MRTTAVLASDTSPEAERAQVELWRRMSPVEKLHAVSESTQAVLQLSLAGIRLRHPEAADEECGMRLAILKLGRELACRAFPEAARLRYTPEDILLQKLRWYRMGNEVSDRQWRDLLGIILVQGDRLDPGYLHTGAVVLGVSDLLQRALSEVQVD